MSPKLCFTDPPCDPIFPAPSNRFMQCMIFACGLLLSAGAMAADWQLSLPPVQRYPADHPASLPAGAVFQVRMDHHALRQASSVRLTLPDGSSMDLDLSSSGETATGDRIVHGHSQRGTQPGHALLTIGAAGLFGQLAAPSGRYTLYTDANGTWLIRLDDSRITVDDDCAVGNAPPTQLPAQSGGRGGSVEQIDIMLVYTPDLQERYPGSLLQTRLNHFIAVTNQAMVDSQIGAVVRLVHHEPVDYTDSPIIFDALAALRLGLAGEGSGVFADLHLKRAAHGADLVMLVWPHDMETRGACGVAYFPFWDEDSETWDDTFGAHVTNDGISNWSVCSDQVFAHELGHNLGAGHQRYDGAPDDINYGFFALGRYNTIMSSFSSADIQRFRALPVYSNPAIQCGGDPCGSMIPGEEANNAQRIGEFAPIVAAYATSVVPGTISPPPPSFPDSDGDGVVDWIDPYPFDFHDDNPPPGPPTPVFVPPPMYPGTSLSDFELLVASSGNDQVYAYAMDGSYRRLAIQDHPPAFPDQRPALSEFTDFDVRADSLVYMLSAGDVRRYDRGTRALLDIFLDSQPPWSPPGNLTGGFPRAMLFSPDQQSLLVADSFYLVRYNQDGFVTMNYPLPSIEDPEVPVYTPAARALAFDTSGQIYLAEALERRIIRFAGLDDPTADDVITPLGSVMTDPWGLEFGADGRLYVANGTANNVLRINVTTGTIETFVDSGSGGLSFARDLTFGPDGQLYVLSRDNHAVLRYDANSGAFIDAFVPPGSIGLDQPQSMKFALRLFSEIFDDRFEP